MISVLNERHSEHSICSDHMHRLATYTVQTLYLPILIPVLNTIFSIELYAQNCAHSIRMQAMQQQQTQDETSVRCPSISARCACLCVFTLSLFVRKVHIVRQSVDSNTFTHSHERCAEAIACVRPSAAASDAPRRASESPRAFVFAVAVAVRTLNE